MQLRKGLTGCRRCFFRLLQDEDAQGSVEFAYVFIGVASLIFALYQFARLVTRGLLLDQAINCAAHHINSTISGIISDVFLY